MDNGTAVIDGSASVHRGYCAVVRAAAVHNWTAVMDGAAFVFHRRVPVVGTATVYNGTTVLDGTTPVHRGYCMAVRTAALHNGTTVLDGTAFVCHGCHLVTRTVTVHNGTLMGCAGFMHGLHSLGRCFMNGRSCLMAGTLPLHRCFHLVAGGTFLHIPPDLLGLRRGSAAAVGPGCRCFRYAHYE
jgi:hypothetical protein